MGALRLAKWRRSRWWLITTIQHRPVHIPSSSLATAHLFPAGNCRRRAERTPVTKSTTKPPIRFLLLLGGKLWTAYSFACRNEMLIHPELVVYPALFMELLALQEKGGNEYIKKTNVDELIHLILVTSLSCSLLHIFWWCDLIQWFSLIWLSFPPLPFYFLGRSLDCYFIFLPSLPFPYWFPFHSSSERMQGRRTFSSFPYISFLSFFLLSSPVRR